MQSYYIALPAALYWDHYSNSPAAHCVKAAQCRQSKGNPSVSSAVLPTLVTAHNAPTQITEEEKAYLVLQQQLQVSTGSNTLPADRQRKTKQF